MASRTRKILEDALRRIRQKRMEAAAPSGKLQSIYNDIARLEEKAAELEEERNTEEELAALRDEERRIKQYFLDEYGELPEWYLQSKR